MCEVPEALSPHSSQADVIHARARYTLERFAALSRAVEAGEYVPRLLPIEDTHDRS